MSIFLEMIIAVVLCSVVFFIVTSVAKLTVYPRRSNEKLLTVVYAKGNSESMEHTVRALIKARDVYGLKMDIAVINSDLSAECARLVNLLERDYDGVNIVSKDELEQFCMEFLKQ